MTLTAECVREALVWLERHGTKKNRDGLVGYGIHAPSAFGVPVGAVHRLAKQFGTNHDLAVALWKTKRYEARLLASFVDDPVRVTAAQMDRWARDFDNWGICDTVCFKLFDQSPHAWHKVEQWSTRREEFVKRAAFALLASLALHNKGAADPWFLRSLALIARAAPDERNFVKKGVSWALRAVGRRNQQLNAAAVDVARVLSNAPEPAARWIGKGALKELTSPLVRRHLTARRRTAGS
jgi:3-methyladenine DNA glycosylase AlkD